MATQNSIGEHMKLTTALTKLKNLKSQLARTEGYIATSVVHFEDEQPEHNYASETETRTKLVNEIMDLKKRIALSNCTTSVDFGTRKVTINELILLNAQLRSELAYWTKMQSHSTQLNIYEARTKEQVKKVFAEGFSKAEVKSKINQLEKSKEQVESILAQANMETDLDN